MREILLAREIAERWGYSVPYTRMKLARLRLSRAYRFGHKTRGFWLDDVKAAEAHFPKRKRRKSQRCAELKIEATELAAVWGERIGQALKERRVLFVRREVRKVFAVIGARLLEEMDVVWFPTWLREQGIVPMRGGRAVDLGDEKMRAILASIQLQRVLPLVPVRWRIKGESKRAARLRRIVDSQE